MSTQGAPKELVEAGVTGELCDPDDADGIAEAALRGLAPAGRPETSAACRRAAARFSWDDAIAPLCEALYLGPDQAAASTEVAGSPR